jgi:O-antigen ligase
MNLRLIKRPFLFAELFFLLFMICYAFMVGVIPGKVVTLMAVCAVGMFGIDAIRYKMLDRLLSGLLPMLPWIAFVVLSYLVLPLVPYAGSRVWNNLTGVIFALTVFMIVRRFGGVPIISSFFMVYVLFVLVFYILFPGLLGAAPSVAEERLALGAGDLGDVGGWNNPNDVARLMGLSALVILGGIKHFPQRLFQSRRWLGNLVLLFKYASVLVAIYIIVFYSGSRSALVWVLAILGYFFASFFNKNLFLSIFLAIALTGPIILAAFLIFPEVEIFSRITILFDEVAMRGGKESSFLTRSNMIKEALSMWMDSPIWGNGNEAFRVQSGYGSYSHCNYTELLANYGLLGLTLFYLPIGIGLFEAWKMRLSANDEVRKQAIWLMICFALLFLISFPNIIYYAKYMLLFYGIVLGRLYYLKDHYQRINAVHGMPTMRHPDRRF